MPNPDYSASMSPAVHASLSERQEAVDEARAVARLLLDRFNAMNNGHDGPEDSDIEAALRIIVDRLETCCDLTDSVTLENEGRKVRLAIVGGSDDAQA